MCGSSSASQKRRNGRNARLKRSTAVATTCVGDGGALSTILTQNRYALYLPLRAAPSTMHRQIGRAEKAHLDVRFVASMRETQKRLQRTPQKRPATPHAEIIVTRVRSLPQLSVVRRALRPFLRF